MSGRLAGRVAIVTGGTRGIGLGIARCLAEDGAQVVCASRGAPKAALGDGLDWRACDVAERTSGEALVREVAEAHGRLDILINNAGIQIEKTVTKTSDEDYDRLMGVNVRGLFMMCRAAIPVMAEGGGGAIVNIGSTSGHAADPGLALYNASKAFVHGLTRSIAVDHGRDGIRCNAVCPGWILTGLADQAFAMARDPKAAERDALARHPVGRMGAPEDIGRLAAWLVCDEAAFVTGQTFTADGGLTAASPINTGLF